MSMKLVLLVSLILFATACNPGSVNNALDRYCDASGCVSVNQFSANIDSQLQNKVVGYVSVVGLKVVEYGQARTSTDAPSRKMASDAPINIASVTKTLTAIAVLQSLAKHNKTVNDKISPYLPADWTKGSNIDTITFRDLLTHSAGFRDNGGGANTTYAIVKKQISDGVQLANKTPLYNNLNFAIFREILPFMEGFNDPGEPGRAAATANFYINYMRQNVFQPVGVTVADCKPAANSHPALYYPFPPGNTPGNEGGDWTLACGGGGWVVTAGNLYQVLNSLLGGNTLLTDAQKTLMNNNCLGWDCSVQTQTDYVGKNGLLVGAPTGGFELNTFIGIFKGKLPVVLIINSDPGQNITGLVANAFAGAGVP